MQFPDITPTPLGYFDPGDGRRIAYRHRRPNEGSPTVLFLPGYASDMEGAKAAAIDGFSGSRGYGCLRLDYSGTGSSGGVFAEGTLTRWLEEVLAAIDLLTEGPLVLAGSSMGAWLALLAALQRKDRVKGLVGIAPAPDFTDWGYTPEEKEVIARDGRIEKPTAYGPEPLVTWRGFLQSGASHRLLHNPIDLIIPVRLVHGQVDEEVDLGVPLKLMSDLRSSDVQLRVIKNGTHRLSEPHEIHAILVELLGLVERTA